MAIHSKAAVEHDWANAWRMDPIHSVGKGRWQWGGAGKVYHSKAAAERQMRAAFANGYRESGGQVRHSYRYDAMHPVRRRRIARMLSVSQQAEHRYVADLRDIIGAVHAAVLKIAEDLHQLPPMRLDANELGDGLVHKIMTWARPRIMTAFERMAGVVQGQNAKKHLLIGINPRHVVGVESVIEHAREENVKLVTRATQSFLEQIRDVLEDTAGLTVEDIREQLEERAGVSRSRATLIARDQTLKLNAQISEHRQRSAGVRKYTWSTSLDERVRPMHFELESTVQSWDDPPVTNPDGDRNHPGEDYQCRCVAIPFIEELEGEEPEGDEEEAEPEEGEGGEDETGEAAE